MGWWTGWNDGSTTTVYDTSPTVPGGSARVTEHAPLPPFESSISTEMPDGPIWDVETPFGHVTDKASAVVPDQVASAVTMPPPVAPNDAEVTRASRVPCPRGAVVVLGVVVLGVVVLGVVVLGVVVVLRPEASRATEVMVGTPDVGVVVTLGVLALTVSIAAPGA